MAKGIVIDQTSIKVADKKLAVTSQYVVYHVELPAGGLIYRRYSEFVWLRDAMCRELPGAIIPALPSGSGGAGNVDPEFVNERKAGLALFLNRLTDNEMFAETECLNVFLTGPDLEPSIKELEEKKKTEMKEQDEGTAKKLADDAPKGDGDGGGWSRYSTESKPVAANNSWFGRLSSSIQSMSNAKKPPPHVNTNEDEEMGRMLLTVNTLLGKTVSLHRSADTMTNARMDLCGQTVDWANSVVLPPTTEGEGETSLQGFCAGVSPHVSYFGDALQRAKATCAQQESTILLKVLSDRIEVSLL
jgi:hypothetical protein